MKLIRKVSVYLTIFIVSTVTDANSEQVECSIKKKIFDSVIDESLNLLKQDDPVLIEAVRKLIIPPSEATVDYNFTAKEPYLMGQYGQVIDLIELLGKQDKGFFIEAGAYDGEEYSNSLYFEMKKTWKGLLVEPNPDALEQLLTKNRKAHIFPRCLSTKKTPEVVEFDAAGLIGGIIHDGKEPGGTTFDPKVFSNVPENHYVNHNRRTIRLQCFPLYSVLMALGNPTVDLFSLDIEGAEIQVLKTIPWDKVNIRVLIIEVNHIGEIFEGSPKKLINLLKKSGYKFFKSSTIDDIYIRKDFKAL